MKNNAIKLLLFTLVSSSMIQAHAQDSTDTPSDSAVAATTQDTANVTNVDQITPSELNQEGIVHVDKVSSEFAEVYRSGELVEKIRFTENDDSCSSGQGQIGKVSVCASKASLELSGRPALECLNLSGIYFGPCELKVKSEEE